MIHLVRVAGHSMEPSLRHGDRVLCAALPPRRGDVIVARDARDPVLAVGSAPFHPRDARWIVKRVGAIEPDAVLLASDHPGHERLRVRRRDVVGRVLLRFP